MWSTFYHVRGHPHRRLCENAALDAAKRFDLQGQADEFLAWYQEIVEDGVATFPKEARNAM